MPDVPHHFLSIGAFFLVTVFFCILVVLEGDLSSFLAVGPNRQALFMDKELDSWTKVFTLYVLSFCVGAALVYYTFVVERKFLTFIWNPAWYKRHKMPFSWPVGYAMVLSQPLIAAIAGLITFFLSKTQQLQFILPHLLGSMVILYPPLLSHLRSLKFAD